MNIIVLSVCFLLGNVHLGHTAVSDRCFTSGSTVLTFRSVVGIGPVPILPKSVWPPTGEDFLGNDRRCDALAPPSGGALTAPLHRIVL